MYRTIPSPHQTDQIIDVDVCVLKGMLFQNILLGWSKKGSFY